MIIVVAIENIYNGLAKNPQSLAEWANMYILFYRSPEAYDTIDYMHEKYVIKNRAVPLKHVADIFGAYQSAHNRAFDDKMKLRSF